MKSWLLPALTAVLLAYACGSGSDKGAGSGAAREPKDPRTVPSATLPPQNPTPLLAIDAGAGAAVRRPTPPPDMYVVKAGDTLGAIAAELGVDLADLLRVNNIEDARNLKVGQQLKVPRIATPTPTARPGAGGAASPARTATPAAGATAARTATAAASPARTATAAATGTSAAGNTYTVQAGDTACDIATRLGVPLAALAEANGATVQDLRSLSIGQVLKVPSAHGPAGC